MKKILVPTDFSKAAQNALDYAIQLAKKIDAEIFLHHAYTMPQSGSAVMIDVSDVLKQDAEKNLAKEVERVQADLGEVTMQTQSFYSGAVASIAEFCTKLSVDLIVMGTTGATGMKEMFVGSNTSALIKETSCPIIAVPAEFTSTEIKNIAVSTDLSHIKDGKIYNPLKELTKDTGGHLTLINISDNMTAVDAAEFINEAADLDDLFMGIEHTFKFIEENDVEKGILNFVNENNIDLLAVVSRKRGFFERLFHKSVSKKLAMHAKVPILILSE